MPTREKTIIAAIKTRLALINGAGNYIYNLTAADRIIVGRTIAAERTPPVAYVFPVSKTTEQTAGRTLLREYDRQLVVRIVFFVPVANDDPGTATDAAFDAANDLCLALESARGLLGSADDVELSDINYVGEELQLPRGAAAVSVDVRIKYREIAAQ